MAQFIRGKRFPKPKGKWVSKIMSANKAINSRPEIKLRQALCNAGLKGYRLHYRKIPGRPDVVFVSKRIVVFVNGCFWHRCPRCNYSLPNHNSSFWKDKFERNIARDKEKINQLTSQSWRVMTIWECQINKDLSSCVRSIQALFNEVYTAN